MLNPYSERAEYVLRGVKEQYENDVMVLHLLSPIADILRENEIGFHFDHKQDDDYLSKWHIAVLNEIGTLIKVDTNTDCYSIISRKRYDFEITDEAPQKILEFIKIIIDGRIEITREQAEQLAIRYVISFCDYINKEIDTFRLIRGNQKITNPELFFGVIKNIANKIGDDFRKQIDESVDAEWVKDDDDKDGFNLEWVKDD